MADGHFTICGTEYPWVNLGDFRFPEWALVREATGLDALAFAEAHHDDDPDAPVDPLVVWGYAMVSFWRGNPLMPRNRAVLEAESWKDGDVRYDAPARADDADPPAEAGLPAGSSSTSESSGNSDDSTP